MDIGDYFEPKWMFRVLIFVLLCSLTRCDHRGNRPAIKMNDIIGPDYDSFQTPATEGIPADVSIQIEILNIRGINVVDMDEYSFSKSSRLSLGEVSHSYPPLDDELQFVEFKSLVIDIFLYKTWRDHRLMFPVKNEKIEKIALNPEWRQHLWTPDVYFHNAIEGKVLDSIIPYVYLWLRNDSTVIFGARLSLEFSCDMSLHKFPHDTQTCDIVVKSLTHTLSEMNLHWHDANSLSVSDFIILPQFEFMDPQTSNCTKKDMMGKHGKFACLRGVIHLTRRVGYYVINIYIPSILIVFMSMLTFWIPVDAVPGRVTLGVTSLLTIITKQYQAALPSVSYVVALNVWLSVCIGFVFCSLLEYAAVVAILSHQKRAETEREKEKNARSLEGENSTCYKLIALFHSKLENIDVIQIDRICRVAFPFIFICLCILYWIFYTKISIEY